MDNKDPSRSDETKHRILEAAARLFGDLGYARTTTRALADAAGVNEVTLFRHFGSKKELFATLIQRYGATSITASMENKLTGDYEKDLLTMAQALMTVLLERKEAVRMMLCEASHFPEIRSVMAQNPRQLRQMFAHYLDQQGEEGLVRSLDPQIAAQFFWGIFFSYGILTGILDDPIEGISADQVIRQFVDIFIHGTIGRSNEEKMDE